MAVSSGDYPGWQHLNILKLVSNADGGHHPLIFLNHVDKLFGQEFHILVTGFMGGSLDCLIGAFSRPRLCFELGGGTYVLVQLQETSCWMMNIIEMC